MSILFTSNIITFNISYPFMFFQKKLKEFEGIPTANEFEVLMKYDDMDADGMCIYYVTI